MTLSRWVSSRIWSVPGNSCALQCGRWLRSLCLVSAGLSLLPQSGCASHTGHALVSHRGQRGLRASSAVGRQVSSVRSRFVGPRALRVVGVKCRLFVDKAAEQGESTGGLRASTTVGGRVLPPHPRRRSAALLWNCCSPNACFADGFGRTIGVNVRNLGSRDERATVRLFR